MPTQVQFRRGTAAQNDNFTGASGELSINTSNNTIRVHDGSTQGGFELSRKADLTTANVTEQTNLYFTATRAINSLSGNTVSIGDLTVTGNLLVQGSTTEISTTSLVVEDKNIVLADGAIDAAAADGAGITIDGASATFTYTNSNDSWSLNKSLTLSGNIIPLSDNTYDLGSATNRFKDLYLTGNSLILGNVTLKEQDGGLQVVNSETDEVVFTASDTSGVTSVAGVIGDVSNVQLLAGIVQAQIDTDDIAEGSGNLYFTTQRARESISVTGSGSYDNTTGVITVTGGVTSIAGGTGDVSNSVILSGLLTVDGAGSGLDADTLDGLDSSAFALDTDLTTANVSEVSNLYFTTQRARDSISVTGSGSYDNTTGIITVTGGVVSVNGETGTVVLSTANISEVNNLYYTDDRVYANIVTTFGAASNVYVNTRLLTKANVGDLNTSNVSEGTNLYFTNARVYANVIELNYATTAYVDEVAEGLKTKPAVEIATTTTLDATYNNGTLGVGATLTANANGAFPEIDGITLSSTTPGENGVLVKNQTNSAHNGRYNLTTVGDGSNPWVLTRCALCDEADEIPGTFTFVKRGTLYAGTGWVQVVDDPSTFTVGTDDIDVFQFSGAGTYSAGDGLDLTGTEFAVDSSVARRTDNLTVFATTTSAQLAGVISDETGSGSLVFANSPTLTGIPQAPTAAIGTANTMIATTAFASNASALASGVINPARVVGSYTNITGVGTISAGTWQGSSISTTYTDAKITSVAGQTGAISNNQLLAAVSAVDGVGSGLDADLLDGLAGGGAGAYALKANNLSVFASTTSAQLAGVISDETGSGSLVFATSPTLSGTPQAPTAAIGTANTMIATTAFAANASALSSGIVNPSRISGSYTGITGVGTIATGTWQGSSISTTYTAAKLTSVAATSPIATSGSTGAITLSHVNSGVSATTYGGATSIPVITVNATGHITSAANVTVTTGTTIANTGSSSTHYVILTTSTSGSISSASISQTKLTFVPSTGVLSATDFNSLSDLTLKENIEPISNSFDIISDLNPVKFNWKDTKNKTFGLIAQDIEKILPNLVTTNDNGLKSVSYIPLISILIDCVKDLKKEIEELKSGKL